MRIVKMEKNITKRFVVRLESFKKPKVLPRSVPGVVVRHRKISGKGKERSSLRKCGDTPRMRR